MATPAIPTGFFVQQGNAQVYLLWNLSAGATSYNIQRSLDNVTFVSLASPTTNSYLDTAVVQGTQYFYKVNAIQGADNSAYTTSQGIIPGLAGELSLQQLRQMSQQRADRVNSNFVSLPEWNTYINQSYFELYDLLVTVYEDYYMTEPYQFITTNQANYDLPNGTSAFLDQNGDTAKPFYKLLGVDLALTQNSNNTSQSRVSLKKFNFIDRNRYIFPQANSNYLGVFNLRYRIMGNKIRFIPTPSAGQYISVWYIPRLTMLLQENDMADGVDGWLEYVIVDAAIKALQKEESDVTVLMAQKEALRLRIMASAQNRDAGQPDTISNTRNYGGMGGMGTDGSGAGF